MVKMRYLWIFLSILVIVFCYNYFIYGLTGDEIWNYGFAYNIATGLVPYRDFNLVVTPLYAFIVSIFILIFGNHLYVMHIFNAIMVSFMFLIMYKKLGKKSWIIFPFLLLISQPGYNFFSLFLTFLIICLYDVKSFKYKNYLIGFMVGLLFLTKQSVGILCIIPMLLEGNGRFKRIIGCLVPIILFICYLLFNGAFYEFFDYCFLGLFEFGGENKVFVFLPFWIVVCGYLIYIFVKSKFKDYKCFYVLCFQIISYPIFDVAHFLIGFVLFLYYLLWKLELKNYQVVCYFIISMIYFLFFMDYYAQLWRYGIYIYNDSCSFFYGRRYEVLAMNEGIEEIEKYINVKYDEYDYLFIFDDLAYLIKLDLGIEINSYDLINNGNMGFKGDERIIEEVGDICSNNSCVFVFSVGDAGTQWNQNIVEYVKDNYNQVGVVNIFDIYSNE